MPGEACMAGRCLEGHWGVQGCPVPRGTVAFLMGLCCDRVSLQHPLKSLGEAFTKPWQYKAQHRILAGCPPAKPKKLGSPPA